MRVSICRFSLKAMRFSVKKANVIFGFKSQEFTSSAMVARVNMKLPPQVPFKSPTEAVSVDCLMAHLLLTLSLPVLIFLFNSFWIFLISEHFKLLPFIHILFVWFLTVFSSIKPDTGMVVGPVCSYSRQSFSYRNVSGFWGMTKTRRRGSLLKIVDIPLKLFSTVPPQEGINILADSFWRNFPTNLVPYFHPHFLKIWCYSVSIYRAFGTPKNNEQNISVCLTLGPYCYPPFSSCVPSLGW